MTQATLMESLLHRMDVDPALIGDLMERRRAGRSAVWLWRQGVIAILLGSAATSRSHPLLTVRAVLTGTVAVAVLRKLAWLPMRSTSRLFGLTVGNYLLERHHDSLRWGFLHYHLFDLPFIAFSCLVYGLAGWAVGRSHREHRSAMLLLFAAAAQAWCGWQLVVHLRDAMMVPKMNLYPYIDAVFFVLLTPSVFIGGLMARGRDDLDAGAPPRPHHLADSPGPL